MGAAQVSGAELAQQCRAGLGSPGSNYCLGFIHSFFDSLMVGVRWAAPESEVESLWNLGICMPGDASIETIRLAIVTYADMHPADARGGAAAMTWAAASTAFPCNHR
ncbi:Rap1a/Tai family immunity protein [Rhodobacter sp. NTK016B]|uniref:Rap1a/Tai family immunity protein n=1 Tax=Rhodobacter sp. NTK016B TaxID=2759676 RepID=UPI0039C8C7A0